MRSDEQTPVNDPARSDGPAPDDHASDTAERRGGAASGLRSPLLWRAAAPALLALLGASVASWALLPRADALVVTAVCAVGGAATLWWTLNMVVRPATRLRDRARRAAAIERAPMSGGGSDAIADAAEAVRVLDETLANQRRALARARQSLEALIDAQTDPAYLTSYDGVVLHCNGAAGAFFGAPAMRIVGRSVRELFTRSDLVALHDAGWPGAPRQIRRRLPTTRGERTYEMVVTPLPATGVRDPAAITFLRDVSDLADTQRVKTDFVANASHELRTPLAAIRAGLETLEQAHDDPRMATRVIGMISGHAARLEELVRDLLDLARVENPELPVRIAPLRLDELTESLRSEFAAVCAQRGLTIEFAIDPALEGAPTDPALVRLILRNLVENATKFCDERTAVRVNGEIERADDGAHVRFAVTDRGMGIPLNLQQRVFERFYQVDPARSGVGSARRGTGLGLAIVRHAARAMGGDAGVDSVWKQGTTTWFHAPTPPRPAHPRTNGETTEQAVGGAPDGR